MSIGYDVIKDMMLYDHEGYRQWMPIVTNVFKWSLTSIMLLAIALTQFNLDYDPAGIFKRWLVAGFIISLSFSAIQDGVDIGMRVGGQIIDAQKGGLVGNWHKIAKEAELKHKQEHKEFKLNSAGDFFKRALFKFSGLGVVDGGFAGLALLLFFITKLIYSLAYYLSLPILQAAAIFSIFPRQKDWLSTGVVAVLFVFFLPILFSLLLSVLNESMLLAVSKRGFFEDTISILKIVTFAGANAYVAWKGVRSISTAGGIVGSAVGAATGAASSIGNFVKSKGTLAASAALTPLAGAALSASKPVANKAKETLKGTAFVASRPVTSSFSAVKDSLANRIQEKSSAIIQDKAAPIETTHSSMLASGLSPHFVDVSTSEKSPLLQNKYESALSQVTSNKGSLAPLNPVNHLKASGMATKTLMRDARERLNERLGIPSNQSFTFKEKAVIAGAKAFSRGSTERLERQLELDRKLKLLDQYRGHHG